jgi:hypothetical protein
VIRIEEKVDFLIESAADHETRLRSIEGERWRWRYGIPVGLLTALGGLLAALVPFIGSSSG